MKMKILKLSNLKKKFMKILIKKMFKIYDKSCEIYENS